MMDNLNLKPQSPDEVKTMMWTGENQREMFDLLTCGKKIDDYMVILSVCSKSVRDRQQKKDGKTNDETEKEKQ